MPYKTPPVAHCYYVLCLLYVLAKAIPCMDARKALKLRLHAAKVCVEKADLDKP